jgi:dTDP-glucose pyrophosphorylase
MLEIFSRDDVHAVLATKEEQNRDAIKRNFAIKLNPDGSVRRVIEKPRHIDNNMKGCGLYLFDLHIFDAIRRTPRTAMRDEYEITDSIQILIDDDYRVMTANIIQDDLNLTFIEDLLELNLFQLQKMNKRMIIGDNCSIPDPDRLENVIVGDNVTIKHPIHIKNAVIFAHSVVDERENISDFIIDSHQNIHCRMRNNRSWRG